MKRKVCVLLLVVLLISFSAHAINFNAEETYNSVVVVYSDSGVGSGFFIEENLIITNAHVVDSNKYVDVILYDDKSLRGKVIKSDEDMDMAIIAVEGVHTPLSFSDGKPTVGQEVYAIGAPRDMPYTMTKGIVSALDRDLGGNKYIQIDASVNSGNSGGPLVDDVGKVMGMITLKATDAEGIGFAIKTADIKPFIEGVTYSSDDNPAEEEKEEEPDESSVDKAELIKLEQQNILLKIILCLSVLANIILFLLCILLFFRNKPKKAVDEFDFEIEIEE